MWYPILFIVSMSKDLVTYTCFDILIRISICCISLPWKVVFKSVFNIMLLKPCILRSYIFQIILVDMLLLISLYYKRASP